MARIGKNQLIKLQSKYKTDEAIGRLYGISRQAVHQLRLKYEMPAVPERLADRNIQLRELYRNGVTGQKLADRFNLSLSQVYRIVRRNSREDLSGSLS